VPFAEHDKLHVPYPDWSSDPRDLENWKEVERWAGRLTNTPLVFHWHGTLSTYVGVRNSVGEFGGPGTIWKIRYRWDPTSLNTTNATIEWYLDTTLIDTHTLPAGKSPHTEITNWRYMEEGITAIATADGGGSGLSAFVYYR